MSLSTVTVDAVALHTVLQALVGPPHYIRELQAIRGLLGNKNAIDVLIDQFNEQLKTSQGSGDAEGSESVVETPDPR